MITKLYSFWNDTFMPTMRSFADFFFNVDVTIADNTYTMAEFFLGSALSILVPIIIAKFVIGIVT